MLFWIIAALLAIGIGVLLGRAMWRGRVAEQAEDSDVQVYRDQLAELDRDLARGVVRAEDAERVRVEIARRMLEADRRQDESATHVAPARLDPVMMGGMGIVLVGGALALYAWIGAPQYPDMPLSARIAAADETRANRPDQAQAEAEFGRPIPPETGVDPKFLDLMNKLRTAVAENPDELRGQMLLARNEAMLGDYVAAYKAQERVIALRGDQATAGDYSDLADLLILAAGGFVSPEAENALHAALQRDPRDGASRYYLGLLHVQNDRPDLGFRIWRNLMGESRPDAPWMPPINAQIERVAELAGVDFTLPAAVPERGPNADDIANAADMSDEDRAEMIRGMVAGLAERLATEGGAPQDWARLIDAYGVLGETDRAGEIWAEAQATYADAPDALAVIRDAAARAGVAE